jgi:two-component system LytT family sensor kinase
MLRRRAALVSTLIVAVSLVFSAQEVLRNAATGARETWAGALVFNLVAWTAWAMLSPLIVMAADRLRLDDGKRVARSAVWVLVGLAVCGAHAVVTGLALRALGPIALVPSARASLPLARYLWTWIAITAAENTIVFGTIAVACHAALYARDLRAQQIRELDLEGRLAHSELTVLRNQLEPHFLFNTLNTVSGLMVHDVPGAQRVIAALGDLLRASTDRAARQEISLRDELALVHRYLEIQRARLRQRLAVHVDLSTDMLDGLVPSLVLQPLVENAIRHGIERNIRGGQVWIAGDCHGDRVTLIVRNDGVAGEGSPSPGTGVGLSNIAARLSQLYGADHTFRAGRAAEGIFEVQLSLPYHTEPVTVAARGPR